MKIILALLLCQCVVLKTAAISFDVDFSIGGSPAGSGYFNIDGDPGNVSDLPYDPATMDFFFDLGVYGTFGPSTVLTAPLISISGAGSSRSLQFLEDPSEAPRFGGTFEIENPDFTLIFTDTQFFVWDRDLDEPVDFGDDGIYAARSVSVPDTAGTGLLAMLAFPLLAFAQRRCQGRRASVG